MVLSNIFIVIKHRKGWTCSLLLLMWNMTSGWDNCFVLSSFRFLIWRMITLKLMTFKVLLIPKDRESRFS